MFAPEFLEEPEGCSHFFQLHGRDSSTLEHNAAEFLWQSLKRGGSAILIATDEHKLAFLTQLARRGFNVGRALHERRILALDAQATLDRILLDGYPDAARFEHVVGSIVRETRHRNPDLPLHAYGEMVGVLWQTRQFPAAIRLEQLWNKLLRSAVDFQLFCSYPIDVFDKQFEISMMGELLGAHTHLLSTTSNGRLESALDRAMNELLDPIVCASKSQAPFALPSSRSVLPAGEATILWLRKNHPEEAEAVLAQARRYFEAAV